MRELEVFRIPGRNNEFRVKKISPTTLLALQVTLDFNDLSKTQSLMNFILEHIEVNINGQWVQFKEIGRDVYYPVGIEKDLSFLTELVTKFLNDYLKPLFTKSNV